MPTESGSELNAGPRPIRPGPRRWRLKETGLLGVVLALGLLLSVAGGSMPVRDRDTGAARQVNRFLRADNLDKLAKNTSFFAIMAVGATLVIISGGNQNAANIQNRIKGALEEATQHPDITIKGPFYSKETPQDAAAKMEEVQTANPDIDGWAMIGSWALFTDALLKWEPGKVKIVAMDALPAELPYLRKGVVARLYAQQTYQWGYRSIEILADKVILKKDPAVAVEYSPLPLVDKSNADQMEQNWKKWLRQ